MASTSGKGPAPEATAVAGAGVGRAGPSYRRQDMRVMTMSWESSAANRQMTSTFLVSPGGVLSPLSSGGQGQAFGFEGDGADDDAFVYVDEEDEDGDGAFAIQMSDSDSGSAEVPDHTKLGAAMTPGTLAAEQQAVLRQVMETLLLPEGLARSLLAHFKYDKARLMERYVENQAATLKLVGWDESGAGAGAAGAAAAGSPVAAADATLDACIICGTENVPLPETTGLSCGHRFCNVCWDGYMSVKIRDGETAQLTCMWDGCLLPVPESVVKRLCTAELFDKYQRFMLQDFVSSHKYVAWCPSKGCANAVKFEVPAEATCSCGHRFCTLCAAECHIPMTCAQLRDWNKKMEEDNTTLSWLATNTKDCPRCLKPIEKNGGCNHMTCRTNAGGCGHEFCWVCGGDWMGHMCNVAYDEMGNPILPNGWPTAAKAEKKDLAKLLFYGGRYKAHEESRALEIKRQKSVGRRIESYRRRHPERAHFNWDFVAEASRALVYCRQTLQYTYASAFYIEANSPERNLFEYLQSELEKRTEALSEELERPLRKLDLRKLKDLTHNALRRLRHLIDGATDGLTADADDRKLITGGKKPWWRRG